MTLETILLVGHGSREKSGNDEILAFAEQWRQRQPTWRIEVCFIEFSEITMSEGLRRAATGSRRVMVVPLILNAAGHVKMDIPQAIDGARLKFPRVQFVYAPHLSAGEPLLAIMKRRLKGAMQALDMPDPTTTGVVMLGRGSSDRHANGEMAKMARWLMEETDHELVDLAFTGITYPRLEKVVQRQSLLGMTQVVVLSYYLFNGTLVERIKRQVDNLKTQYPTIRFSLTTYFGFEREIFEVLEQRVDDMQRGAPEALMPCDGCKFREFAVEHGQGGHHHDDALPYSHDHDHPHDHPHEHEHGHEHPHVPVHAGSTV
ncbi:sirohydrochlorin chelatase [Hydrogenophaga sp.]|uniref:sirohydrochlorin chelatase n=1 Tax=Hydrogenophaga sp. TaxID=1904254 RepID=UPI0003F3F2ED|nr:sirohydrochlorin chelatase [Hydrogenophaga sp.]EWS64373.1 Sirohydrochlorin cobaltochelatase [Hydrogenophaga sp. T4]MDP3325076.1 sirohydrochlorin chelatase [Hydrogenophaga sp.]MDP3883445.1 sirohydrochlorin chelatase [Hydrogenophaga sp.]MDZ4177467.1 sirohydrochlorin chelatase [Hydrogenophaga sp.]